MITDPYAINGAFLAGQRLPRLPPGAQTWRGLAVPPPGADVPAGPRSSAGEMHATTLAAALTRSARNTPPQGASAAHTLPARISLV